MHTIHSYQHALQWPRYGSNLSVHQQMNGGRRWGIYTQKTDYSAIKKNEILPFATTWIDLEGIILSEISQRKTNMCVIT